MGKLQEFEITFTNNKVVYSPGESISGTVKITSGTPLPYKGGKADNAASVCFHLLASLCPERTRQGSPYFGAVPESACLKALALGRLWVPGKPERDFLSGANQGPAALWEGGTNDNGAALDIHLSRRVYGHSPHPAWITCLSALTKEPFRPFGRKGEVSLARMHKAPLSLPVTLCQAGALEVQSEGSSTVFLIKRRTVNLIVPYVLMEL
ncbi:hypothetical protein SKAU_G00362490 [Synaphobranchus kaupii]|uniref:Uncharacterized protein n=1 Tax=Synaphobranchus kaupii TaxID=118154 RepID=A0A9Q1IF31_SYNKA|nr:hypothetical protein SKAU_G00362490 [Synaphobranchus kaupii]